MDDIPQNIKFEKDFSKIESGLYLYKDVEPTFSEDTNFTDLEAVFPILEKGGSYYSIERASIKLNCNFGQCDAEKLIKFLNSDKGQNTSKKFQPFLLVFPGTVWAYWVDPPRVFPFVVPCIYWSKSEKQWQWCLRNYESLLCHYSQANTRFLVYHNSPYRALCY